MKTNHAEFKKTMADADFAIGLISDLSMSGDDDIVHLRVGPVRDCLELMLSLLEVYEGVDVDSLERMKEFQNTLHVSDSALPN